MNIIVKTYNGKIIVRPDTTWERDNEDFYPPDYIDSLSFTPIIAARIAKPGKSIGANFVSRYYDSICFGILLYPDNLLDNTPQGFACASCIDHTSFISLPTNNESLSPNGIFSIESSGILLYENSNSDITLIEQAICESSKRIYLRTGDLVTVELSEIKKLIEGNIQGKINIKGCYCGKPIIYFNIIR